MINSQILKKIPLELFIWPGALLLLYLAEPSEPHFDVCPIHRAGFDWCPGCGLGRSISLFLHGDISGSFTMHKLGIPVFLVLLHRIYILTKKLTTRLSHGTKQL